MLKKRLIGVVTVKDGWAVQSFGYRRYLPLGRPEVLVQNLDRWGADEILVQCIDRSASGLGPDLVVLGKISKLGIATPLIYAGGIGCREDAVKVVSQGADRLMVDAMLLDSPQSLEGIARDLGVQAVIAHLSARVGSHGLLALEHRDRSERPLERWLERLDFEWISELMVTDWQSEGSPGCFNEGLLEKVVRSFNKPLLCFGGISEASQIERVLSHPQVVGAGVGNFLTYHEHAIQMIKKDLGNNVRAPKYERSY